MTRRLVRNAGRCLQCQEVVESTYRWDYRSCGCGAIAVDGGLAYLKRTGNPLCFEELSEYEEVGVEDEYTGAA